MIYRIAFLGPPGSGKGTQAERLAPVLGIPIVGPGALYRREIAEGTDLGKQVAKYVEAGEMAPNEITNMIIERRIRESDCASGFIFDGFPREIEQLQAIDQFSKPLTHAILLNISEGEVVHRLSERLVCICGKQFNSRELVIEPGAEAICMACEGRLERRKDDDPESIAKRIAHYHAQTEPVIAEYRKRGILIEINGARPIEVVHQDILVKLGVAMSM